MLGELGDADQPGRRGSRRARDAAWVQLHRVHFAAALAGEALGQLTAGRCPGCARPVIHGGPGGRIYGTEGAPHTCPDIRPAG